MKLNIYIYYSTEKMDIKTMLLLKNFLSLSLSLFLFSLFSWRPCWTSSSMHSVVFSGRRQYFSLFLFLYFFPKRVKQIHSQSRGRTGLISESHSDELRRDSRMQQCSQFTNCRKSSSGDEEFGRRQALRTGRKDGQTGEEWTHYRERGWSRG